MTTQHIPQNPETIAEVSDLSVRAARGQAALAALGNHVAAAGASTAIGAGAFADVIAAPAITPKVSGKFLVTASLQAAPAVNGLTACGLAIFDGAGRAAGGPTSMGGLDTGGTVTTRTMSVSFSQILTGYVVGTPVTFSLQANPSTQGLAAGTAQLTVVELPA